MMQMLIIVCADDKEDRDEVAKSTGNSAAATSSHVIYSALNHKTGSTLQTDWLRHLPFVVNAYNSTVRGSPLLSHVWKRAV